VNRTCHSNYLDRQSITTAIFSGRILCTYLWYAKTFCGHPNPTQTCLRCILIQIIIATWSHGVDATLVASPTAMLRSFRFVGLRTHAQWLLLVQCKCGVLKQWRLKLGFINHFCDRAEEHGTLVVVPHSWGAARLLSGLRILIAGLWIGFTDLRWARQCNDKIVGPCLARLLLFSKSQYFADTTGWPAITEDENDL
jgi:hypothetical protein